MALRALLEATPERAALRKPESPSYQSLVYSGTRTRTGAEAASYLEDAERAMAKLRAKRAERE